MVAQIEFDFETVHIHPISTFITNGFGVYDVKLLRAGPPFRCANARYLNDLDLSSGEPIGQTYLSQPIDWDQPENLMDECRVSLPGNSWVRIAVDILLSMTCMTWTAVSCV